MKPSNLPCVAINYTCVRANMLDSKIERYYFQEMVSTTRGRLGNPSYFKMS